MFVKENTLSAIKEYFFNSLEELYPKEEIQSFYSIFCEHYLGLSRTDLILKNDKNLSESELLKFYYGLKDLKKQKPIQYIIGSQFFYNNEFKVNEHTLIPRAETEELVDIIVKENSNFEGRLLDIGTGSGVIAISLDKALFKPNIIAFDISKEAIQIAKLNNKQIVSDVNFELQDILNPSYSDEPFDIVVSNPPYVLESEKNEMKENVLGYEPHIALFVKDSNPLLFYQAIVDFCNRNLNSGGKLYFEINEKYGRQTVKLLENREYLAVKLIKDMQGKNRFVKGVKS